MPTAAITVATGESIATADAIGILQEATSQGHKQ
jgi:hypothetical protein